MGDINDMTVLTVTSLGTPGDGIARLPSGQVVFIPDTLPGDTVEIDGIVAQIRSRRSWLYSSAIKKLQQKEQLDGTATPQEKHSWYIYQRQDSPNNSDS